MKTVGKILFFNVDKGSGILMTSDKKKITFEVQAWDDFETMPALGLEVIFNLENGIPSSIVSKEHEEELARSSQNETQEVEAAQPQEPPQQEALQEIEALKEESPQNYKDFPVYTDEQSSIQEKDELTSDTHNNKEEENPEDEEEIEYEQQIEEDLDNEVIQREQQTTELLEKEDDEPKEERVESLTITLNINHAVDNYFKMIEENINKRMNYTKLTGRLDYLLIRRFLWTTYNNLSELDLHIITPKIKLLGDDLKVMAGIYDDFRNKTRYPTVAYQEVFLSCQAEYMKIKEGTEKVIEKLNLLRGNEEKFGKMIKVKKDELAKAIQSEEFDILQNEMKSLKGAYVDTVHMMAELDERYKHDLQLLKDFEQEYKSDFYEVFSAAAKKYKGKIVEILSAQAFLLDAKLWQKAKTSKSIKAHFQQASIDGELNTKTYLKYYLETQDSTKLTEETQALLDLYNYLCSVHKEYIMIISSSAQDAMEYEGTLKRMNKELNAKSFIDETTAIKWATQNSVKLVIVDERLRKMTGDRFLKYYLKYVFSRPKIIFLGNKPKTDDYTITSLLSANSSPRLVASNVISILNDNDKKEKLQ